MLQGPKTQNKPSNFFLNGGLPNRGGGGGVRHLGKTPKKPRIFFLTGSLINYIISLHSQTFIPAYCCVFIIYSHPSKFTFPIL